MSKTMKVILSVVGLFVAFIAICIGYLYFAFSPLMGNAPPNRVVKNYIEEKYDFEIDIIEVNTFGMGGPPEFIVSPEENEDIRFKVTVDSFDHTIIEDDYPFALEADEEYQKLKAVIPAIEALGFTGEGHPDIRLNYYYDSISLILMDNEGLNFKTFEADELDRYYKLYELIKQSQAEIDDVIIADDLTDYVLTFFMESLSTVKTKEEFLIELKINQPQIVSHEVVRQWSGAAKDAENDRFYFGSRFVETHGDSFDPWLNCIEVDENAECISASITVTYQEDGFNSSNPYFAGDLTAIFAFIGAHLEPEIQVESITLEANDLSGDRLEIGYEERMQYENVDELINILFSRQ